MEDEKTSDDKPKHTSKHVRCNNEVGSAVVNVVSAQHVHQHLVRSKHNHLAQHRRIEEHVQKVLVVVEPDAVGYPWTVVIHLQNAFVALRAVMASVWLGAQTSLAHSNSTVLLAFERLLDDCLGGLSVNKWLIFYFNCSIFRFIKRSSLAFNVLVVQMTCLLWSFLVFNDFLVDEVFLPVAFGLELFVHMFVMRGQYTAQIAISWLVITRYF